MALRARLEALYARLKAAPIARRLASGTFWSLASLVVTRIVTLASTVALARTLGKDVFGKLSMVQATVLAYASVASLGTGPTATKYVAELRTTDPERAGRILGFSGLVSWGAALPMAAAVFALAPILAADTLKAPELSGSLRIATLMLLVGATNGAQTGALTGLEAFQATAKATTITGIFTTIATVAGALLGGLDGAVAGATVGALVTWAVYHVTLRREARRFGIAMAFDGATKERSVFWRFSLPSVLAGLAITPVQWFTSAILARTPAGYEELSVLTVAKQWQGLVLLVPTTLAGVLLPVLVNLEGEKDGGTYRKTMRAGVLVTGASAGVAAVVLSLGSKLILRGYGASFTSGWPVMVILSASSVLVAVCNVVGVAITSQGRMWVAFWLNAIWGVATVLATLGLVRWGAAGLAGANLVAYAVHLCTSYAVVRWVLVRPPAKEAEAPPPEGLVPRGPPG